MSEICFALRNGKCSVLNTEKCTGKCSFYKTFEESKQDTIKVNKRLSSLDKSTQRHIADTYYKDKLPWLESPAEL